MSATREQGREALLRGGARTPLVPLIHRRDPVRGLAAVRSTLTPGGRIQLLDAHGAQARWHVALEALR